LPYSVFNHVKVAGVSVVAPADTVSLADEAEYYGGDKRKLARITDMIGLDKRRLAPEGITPSDLCIQAAERLFAEMDIDKNTIDALVFVTQSPDYPVPATAFVQQNVLDLPKTCAVFDVNLGCSGYVYGLWMAGCMIESRACSRVLLMAGDGAFRLLPPANRIITPLFGDAGSATLLEFAENATPLSFSLYSDGSGYEALIRPGGGARIPELPDSAYSSVYHSVVHDSNGTPWTVGGFGNTYMDGMAVLEFTMTTVPPHILDHMTRLGVTPDDIDWLVLHQGNKQIVQNIAEQTGFPLEKTPWQSLLRYGNQAVASIPGVICDQLKSACGTGNRLNLMLCGFGIGLSWASCIGDFSGLKCCGIHDFMPPAHVHKYLEQIAYWHKKFRGE